VPKEELPEDGVAILENLEDRICDFGFDTQYYPSEGTPPNAADRALIAAAPDLRKVVHDLCVTFAYVPQENLYDALRQLYDKARAALEKADGR
jgi:hypothetical protein